MQSIHALLLLQLLLNLIDSKRLFFIDQPFKTIQELVKEYDDREKLDERLKQMTAKELLLRDKAYFEMKWCGASPFIERFLMLDMYCKVP